MQHEKELEGFSGIFSNCPDVPKDWRMADANVHYVAGLTSAPSAELSLCWLDEISEYLDDSHVIHD